VSEEAAVYQVKRSLCKGYLYRGEIILATVHDVVVIWPTWLKGLQVALANETEARAFVDAHSVWEMTCTHLYTVGWH
jgi:hypothetical protein